MVHTITVTFQKIYIMKSRGKDVKRRWKKCTQFEKNNNIDEIWKLDFIRNTIYDKVLGCNVFSLIV